MSFSLTRRLLVYCTVSLLSVVLATSALAWALMRRDLYKSLDDGLRAEAAAVASRLEVDEGRLALEAPPGEREPFQMPGALLNVVDDAGAVVLASPAAAATEPLLTLTDTGGPAENDEATLASGMARGEAYRVASVHRRVVPDEEDTGEPALGAWVFVARPLAPLHATLRRMTTVQLGAAAFAVLAVVIGARLAVRRGLQPLHEMAAALGQTAPHNPRLAVHESRTPVELRPVVAAMERLLARIRDELRRQRCLTADVAHDLRTPVAGVRTLLDVTLQRERSAQDYAAAMEQGRAALRQLSALLDDVLTLSRLDAGVDEVHAERVLLADIAGAALAIVAPMAAARGVTIETGEYPAIELMTDRAKAAKILTNLLSNAVEHGHAGGVVRMDFRRERASVECSVSDRGPGIPPDLRIRVFDRFVRADASRAGDNGHHGLGLPIAASLGRLLGGEVRLDESHTPGARFVVRLPLTPPFPRDAAAGV